MNKRITRTIGTMACTIAAAAATLITAPLAVPLIKAAMAHSKFDYSTWQTLLTGGAESYFGSIRKVVSDPSSLASLGIWFTIVSLFIALLAAYAHFSAPKRTVPGGVLGDARLITSMREIRAKNDFWDGKGAPKEAGLVLGANERGYIFDSSVPGFLSIGKTGAGKSMLMVIETMHLLMAAAWNIICSGKSELVELTGAKALELGYERVIFDLRGYPSASRFNPIDLVAEYAEAGQVAEAQRTARQTAADIVPLEGGNDYFPKAARSELTAIILLVAFADIPRTQKNMASVCEVINRGTTGTGRDPSVPLKDYIRSLGAGHPCFQAAKQFLADGGLTVAGKNVGTTLDEALAIFSDEGMRELTAESDVSIRDIVRRKTIVYMHLLEDGDPYQVVFSAFLNQYWRVAQQEAQMNAGRLPHETAILGDEFGNLPKVQSLGEIATLGRAMKLHPYLFAQDLKQFNKYNKPGDGGAGRDKVLGSLGGKVALSLANPEDFAYFTKLAGKRTVRTRGTSEQRSGSGKSGSGTSYSETADDLIHEWEWQSLIPIRDGSTVIKGGENAQPGREGVFRMPLEYAPNTPAGAFFGLGDEAECAAKRAAFHAKLAEAAAAVPRPAESWCPDFESSKSAPTITNEIEYDEFGAWDGLE